MSDQRVRILVVEDDEVDRLALRRFVDREGLAYDLTEATTVDEALDCLSDQAFDLVLIDHVLPDGSGLDVQKRCEGTPSIFITGAADPQVAVEALKTGAMDLVVKDHDRRYLEFLPPAIDGALEKQRIKDELQMYQTKLEELVHIRTAELQRINTCLQREIEERRRAERYLNRFFDISPDMMCVVKDGAFIRINQAWSRKLKYPTGYIYANELTRFVHPDDLPATREVATECYQGTPVAAFRNRYLTSEGGVVWLEWSAVTEPLTGMTYAVARDVTEQTRILEALKESELKYRTIFEHSQDGISMFERFPGRLARRLLDCNERYAEMAGRPRQELMEILDFGAIQIKDHSDRDSWSIQADIEAERPYQGTFSWLRPDGAENYIEYRAVPVRIGDRLFVFGIDRDVTERVRTMRALAESEASFRAVFEQAAVGISRVEPGGRILDANATFCRMMDMEPEEISRLTIQDITHPDDIQGNLALLERLAAGELESFNYDKRYLKPNGGVLWTSLTVTAVRDDQRRLAYFIAVIQDITDRKQAEAEILANQNQLRRLASDLAVAESRERRQLALELHDEIGQNLFLANMKLGVLAQKSDQLAVKAEVAEVADLVERAQADIRGLLNDLNPPALSILGLKKAILSMAEDLLGEYDIELVYEDDDGQPIPVSDDVKDLMYRAVRELFYNVVKHSQASRVELAIECGQSDVRITVRDNGVGFEPGQFDPTSRDQMHFGLFSIRERFGPLGGRLTLVSEPGRGTLVSLLAPLALPEKTAPDH